MKSAGKWYLRVALTAAIVVTVALVLYRYVPQWITMTKSAGAEAA
jgi:hypothetical protein